MGEDLGLYLFFGTLFGMVALYAFFLLFLSIGFGILGVIFLCQPIRGGKRIRIKGKVIQKDMLPDASGIVREQSLVQYQINNQWYQIYLNGVKKAVGQDIKLFYYKNNIMNVISAERKTVFTVLGIISFVLSGFCLIGQIIYLFII